LAGKTVALNIFSQYLFFINFMSKAYRNIYLLAGFVLIIGQLSAQKFQLKNYSVGIRIFEQNDVGNNPLTITAFLKDPVAYQQQVNNFQYNGLRGDPGISVVKNYYINTEWYKPTAEPRFWKKYSLQMGLQVSQLISQPTGSLSNQYVTFLPDTVIHKTEYSLSRRVQFVGLNAGLNRRYRLGKKVQLLAGLHLQGGFALLHKYYPQTDNSTITIKNGTGKRQHFITSEPALKGTNYFQWQAMVPLGIEVALYQNRLFARAEVMPGFIKNRYRTVASKKEAHGAGIWLIYQPAW